MRKINLRRYALSISLLLPSCFAGLQPLGQSTKINTFSESSTLKVTPPIESDLKIDEKDLVLDSRLIVDSMGANINLNSDPYVKQFENIKALLPQLFRRIRIDHGGVLLAQWKDKVIVDVNTENFFTSYLSRINAMGNLGFKILVTTQLRKPNKTDGTNDYIPSSNPMRGACFQQKTRVWFSFLEPESDPHSFNIVDCAVDFQKLQPSATSYFELGVPGVYAIEGPNEPDHAPYPNLCVKQPDGRYFWNGNSTRICGTQDWSDILEQYWADLNIRREKTALPPTSFDLELAETQSQLRNLRNEGKRIPASIQVMSPSLVNWNGMKEGIKTSRFTFPGKTGISYWDALREGGVGDADIANVHLYDLGKTIFTDDVCKFTYENNLPRASCRDKTNSPNGITLSIDRAREFVGNRTKPLAITEFGTCTGQLMNTNECVPSDLQGSIIVRSLLNFWRDHDRWRRAGQPGLDGIFIYNFMDSNSFGPYPSARDEREATFGVVDSNGKPKPAFGYLASFLNWFDHSEAEPRRTKVIAYSYSILKPDGYIDPESTALGLKEKRDIRASISTLATSSKSSDWTLLWFWLDRDCKWVKEDPGACLTKEINRKVAVNIGESVDLFEFGLNDSLDKPRQTITNTKTVTIQIGNDPVILMVKRR